MTDLLLKSVALTHEEVESLVARFIKSLQDKRPETRGTYQRALREFTRWFPLDGAFRFQVADVLRYKDYLTNQRRLSAVSVSTYLTALRRCCEYLISLKILDANPARYVDGNKRPSVHSRETLSGQDVNRLLDVMDKTNMRGLRDFAVIRLMLDAALSEIEIVRSDVSDLEKRGETTILRVQGKGRGAKDEAVELSPATTAAIDQYLALRKPASGSEPFAMSQGNRTRGKRMTTRGIRDRVNYYLELAGIKQGRLRRVTPYSLRHTAAVMLADAGASPDEIRRRMRLGSIATAMLYINHKNRRATPNSTTTLPS